jgi:hypothetical protein
MEIKMNNMNPEETWPRIARIIKAHGGEIVTNPQGDGKQVIINFDDMVELILDVEFDALEDERAYTMRN